jgi:hypothetical protein
MKYEGMEKTTFWNAPFHVFTSQAGRARKTLFFLKNEQNMQPTFSFYLSTFNFFKVYF